MGGLTRLRWDLGLGRELGFAFWAMFFLEGAFGAYWNIWPLYIERLGAPITVVGLLLGANGILRLFVMPPSAAIADRIGARRVLVAARSAALIGYIGAVFAQHWTHLLIVVIGIAIGELAFPQIQAHVATQATGNAVRAFAIIFVVGPSVALGMGPLISGLLIGQFGIRSALVFTAFLTFCSILCFAALRDLPASRRVRMANADRGIESESKEEAGTYRTALSDPAIRRILILHFAVIFSLGVGVSFVPTFLNDVRGLSVERIAQFGALQAIGSITFGIAVTRVGWLQRNPFAGVSIAVFAVASGLMLFVTSGNPVLLVVAFICRGGLFSGWALFAAAMGQTAKPRDRPRAFALVEIGGGTAFSFAPIIAGPLYASIPRLPLTIGIVLGVTLVPLLWLAQRQAHRGKTSENLDLDSLARQDQI